MKVVEIGKTAEGRPQLHGDHHVARELKKLDHYQGDRPAAGARRGADRRAGARARARRQGGRLDRRRAARDRGARRAAADRDRSTSWSAATIPRRCGSCNDVIILCTHVNPDGMELVSNWYMREADPLKRSTERHAAALPEVRRPRRQPRLLHVEPAGDARTIEQRAVPRVVPADRLQPPPDRARPAR